MRIVAQNLNGRMMHYTWALSWKVKLPKFYVRHNTVEFIGQSYLAVSCSDAPESPTIYRCMYSLLG